MYRLWVEDFNKHYSKEPWYGRITKTFIGTDDGRLEIDTTLPTTRAGKEVALKICMAADQSDNRQAMKTNSVFNILEVWGTDRKGFPLADVATRQCAID